MDASVEQSAAEEEPKFHVTQIAPAREGNRGGMTHATDPASLLALSQVLYGHAPQAWLVTVAGEWFEGQQLSEPARRRAGEAIRQISQQLQLPLMGKGL